MIERIVTPNSKKSESTNNSFCPGLYTNASSKAQNQKGSKLGDSAYESMSESDFVSMESASKLRKQVVIIGGEGHGTMIAEAVQDNREKYCEYEWEIAGFCNDYHEKIDGYPVLGRIDDIPKLLTQV